MDNPTNTENIRQIKITDLKVGMVYRHFPNDRWSTVKTIRFSRNEDVPLPVLITTVEGGGLATGLDTLIYIKEDN